MKCCNVFRLKNDCAINCLLFLSNEFYSHNLTLAHYLSTYSDLHPLGITKESLPDVALNLGVNLTLDQKKNFDFNNKKLTFKKPKWYLVIYYDRDMDNHHAILVKPKKDYHFDVYDPQLEISELSLEELYSLEALEIYETKLAKKAFFFKLKSFKMNLNLRLLFYILWPSLLVNLSIIPSFFFWKTYFNVFSESTTLICFLILFVFNCAIFIWSTLLLQHRYKIIEKSFLQKIIKAHKTGYLALTNSNLFEQNINIFAQLAVKKSINYMKLICSLFVSAINWCILIYINVLFFSCYIAFLLLSAIVYFSLITMAHNRVLLLKKINSWLRIYFMSANFIIIIAIAAISALLGKFAFEMAFSSLCFIGLAIHDFQTFRNLIIYYHENLYESIFIPSLFFYKLNHKSKAM